MKQGTQRVTKPAVRRKVAPPNPRAEGFWAGVRAAAYFASQYNATSTHPYRLDDCILCKLNVPGAPARPRVNRRANSGDFERGYIQAVAEFARRPTSPADVLSAAGITLEVAEKVRVLSFDMEAIRPHLARSKARAAKNKRTRTASARVARSR